MNEAKCFFFFVECEDCSFGSEKSQYKDMKRFIFVHQSVEFDIYVW